MNEYEYFKAETEGGIMLYRKKAGRYEFAYAAGNWGASLEREQTLIKKLIPITEKEARLMEPHAFPDTNVKPASFEYYVDFTNRKVPLVYRSRDGLEFAYPDGKWAPSGLPRPKAEWSSATFEEAKSIQPNAFPAEQSATGDTKLKFFVIVHNDYSCFDTYKAAVAHADRLVAMHGMSYVVASVRDENVVSPKEEWEIAFKQQFPEGYGADAEMFRLGYEAGKSGPHSEKEVQNDHQ